MKWALEKLSVLPAWKTPLATFGVADKILIDLILPWWVLTMSLLCVSVILWRRRILYHVFKSSVTCVSKIYMVPSQWNKQSIKMCSAPVGPSAWENLFSSKENKFLERYQRGTLHCRAVCWWELLQRCAGHQAASQQGLNSGQTQQQIYYTARSHGSSTQPSFLYTRYFLFLTHCEVTCASGDPETTDPLQTTTNSNKT